VLSLLRTLAGFRHSAFTFGAESVVAKSNINGVKIPPGQLINFVQKGIMYTELERSVGEDGSEAPSTEPFSLLRSADGKGGGPSSDSGPPAKKQHTEAPAPASSGNGDHSSSADGVSETPEDAVTTLQGHTSEVFICAWSPTSLLLASGSGDSTARIWRVPNGPCGKGQAAAIAEPAVLQHLSSDKEKSKDVTTLDWNHNGSALATGSYDGQARIWSSNGKLTQTLSRHKGPIFSLKWNSTGRCASYPVPARALLGARLRRCARESVGRGREATPRWRCTRMTRGRDFRAVILSALRLLPWPLESGHALTAAGNSVIASLFACRPPPLVRVPALAAHPAGICSPARWTRRRSSGTRRQAT
jgi:hypothetical protein